jgi:hypothetical protein
MAAVSTQFGRAATRGGATSTSARRARRRRIGLGAVALAVALALGIPASAVTPVDCDTPDDFCTGDPCVTQDNLEVTVGSCVLDFGGRALVLAKVTFLPNAGSLSLTAGSIDVQRRIDGQHVDATSGDGADISLSASGNITIGGRLDGDGRNSTGTITVDAGGNVDMRDKVRSRSKGHVATATGGTITVQADGTVTSVTRATIDVRGKRNSTAAGQVTIGGDAGVTLNGQVDVRGNPGGTASINSAAGDVSFNNKLRGEGSPGGGGSFIIDAAGNLTLNTPVKVSGGAPGGGGTVALTAGTAAAIVIRNVTASGLGAPAGTVSATGGSFEGRTITARGTSGGTIDITSTSGNVLVRRVRAEGRTGTGGTLIIDSALDLNVENGVRNAGGLTGGSARFTSVGDMLLGDSPTRRFDVTGTAGGVIDGQAGGNLTAEGRFTAAAGGCIGLSAGGTLDTTAAQFDVPLTASCP